MNGYNFSGLWFEIYGNVIQQNNQLGNRKLDKNQLREVATSIFIAATRKGISRPEDEEKAANVEVPSHLKGLNGNNGNGDSNNGSGNGNSNNNGYLATEAQLKSISKLLDNPLVTDKEKQRIENILAEPEISKSTASDVLSYFYGHREKLGSQWVKVSGGVLDVRRSQKQPA